MKLVKVDRVWAKPGYHHHWEVVEEGGHDLWVPDDVEVKPGMKWSGNHESPTQADFTDSEPSDAV